MTNVEIACGLFWFFGLFVGFPLFALGVTVNMLLDLRPCGIASRLTDWAGAFTVVCVMAGFVLLPVVAAGSNP